MSSERGRLISVEGVDGAGKSTQVAALAAALRRHLGAVEVVRDPGDTELGELARGYLLQRQAGGALDPWAEALLFIAARAQLIGERIVPALDRGVVVLCDRFVDSTLAYQGAGRGLGTARLRELHRVACRDVWPDLTVLLDLPLDVARGRRTAAELPLDRIEGSADRFHTAVSDAFRQLAGDEPGRIVVVDASRPAAEVARQVEGAVLDRLGVLAVRPES